MKRSEPRSAQVITEFLGCYEGSDITGLNSGAASAPEPDTEHSFKSH